MKAHSTAQLGVHLPMPEYFNLNRTASRIEPRSHFKKLFIFGLVGMLFIKVGAMQVFDHDAETKTANQWEVVDIHFKTENLPPLPEDVAFSAELTCSGSADTMTVSGFYNGGNTYLIRFCPDHSGVWSYQTTSDKNDLNGLKGELQIDPPLEGRKGGIKLNPESPREFIYANGDAYYPICFEVDWLFALDAENPDDIPVTRKFVDTVAENGYNQLIMNVFAYDVGWKKDPMLKPEHDYSSPKVFPFAGNNKAPDHTKLNTEYFRRLDRVIDYLDKKGIAAHLMIYVWNKEVNWPKADSAEDNRYFDYVVRRYQAYPNMVWDISKEALGYGRDDVSYITRRIDRLRKLDTYNRLVTVHDYGYCKNHKDKLDFASIQLWDSELTRLMIKVREDFPDKPVLNIEHGGYEKSPYVVFPGNYDSSEVCLERAYQCVFAGTYFGSRMTMWERLDFHRENTYDPAPLLRREFSAPKAIKQAQAFISGIGYCELYLNGQRVGDRVLDPGWTDCRKTVLYASYDVTEHLKRGDNAVGVMLGRGHYGQTAVDHWGFYKEDGYIGQPKLKCLVRVTYVDGTVENIITDQNWKVTGGPVVFDCPHMGEVYDATLEIKDWSQPGPDEQGRLSVIAPNNNYNLGTSPLWSSACVHLPWYMYTYYGDTRLFETYWEQMMAYTRAAWTHCSMKEHPGLFLDVLSDWSSPFGNRPDEGSEVYSSMNFYRVLKRLAHMGKLLDKQADVVLLEKQAEQIREAIYSNCFDPELKVFSGLKPTDYRQGPNALALHYDIVKPEHREAVQQRLIRDIRVDRENHIYGGIFTGMALWDLLPQIGQAELACDVAVNNTHPSYGYMLENGATTLWEHWPDTSSHIHYFMGFVDNFFYRYVAGLNINEENPGFSEILFTPKLLSRLEHASGNYQSIQGPISINWQRKEKDVEIRLTVPCNSRGKLILPEDVYADQGKTILLESGTHLMNCKVIEDIPSANSDPNADKKEIPASQQEISGADLRKQFTDPPAEFRLAVDSFPAQEYVNEGHAGALLLDGLFPPEKKKELMDPTWMTNPELFEKLSRQISEAKEKGYKTWFYDELKYPSCSAGGRVTEGHPELQAQMLRYRSFPSAGDELTVKPEGKVVLCAAFPVQNGIIDLGKKVVLTEKAAQGEFKWKPPVGDWKLCLYEWVPSEAWKFHDQSRPMGNIMDRRATERFIELTHNKLKKELGDQVKDIFLFFTDEPQLNNVEYWIEPTRKNIPPAVAWAEELPLAFEAKYGYPIIDALPALFDKTGERTGHFRHDFYDVSSDLIAKNYWGQIQDWCHANGTYSSGHMLLEESLLYSVMFSGSVIKNWERSDLPGVDLLQLPKYQTMMGDLVIGKEGFACKMAASIATFRNKPGVFSESYAVCNIVQPEEGHLSAAKGVAAWQFQQGITHMFTYSIQKVLNKPECIKLADFAGRLALLCRRGRPVSDVAVLIPEASSWAFYNPPDGGPAKRYWQCNPDVEQIDTIFNDTCFALSSSQIDFEMLTERLLQQAVVKQGRLHLGDQSFAVLMLPESRMLSAASIRKIEAFVREKGRVIFVGNLPYMSPRKGMDADIQRAAEGLLGAESVLHVGTTEQLPSAVDWIKREVPPEVAWQGENVVRLAHQREKGREVIMIANPSLTDATGKLACRFAGNASVWNPEDGSVTDIGLVKSGVGFEVSIPRNSARFVVIE